jgi:hypothetical protein
MEKTVKRGFYLLITTLIIILIYSNSSINGVWVGTHSFFTDSGNFRHINESALMFSNQRVSQITPFKSNDSILKSFYFVIGNKIFSSLIDENTISQKSFKNYNNDSILLIGDNLTKVYKKIPDSLKYNSMIKPELENNFFKLKNNNKIDTVFLIGEFLFIKKNINEKMDWDSSGYWRLKKVNSFYILFSNFNPIIITESKDNLIFHQVLSDRIETIEAIQLKKDSSELRIIEKIIERDK